LPLNLVLYGPNQSIECAYFPKSGILSVVSLLENGSSIEVATIGRDGMIGSVLLLHTETSPYLHFVQVAGHGFRVSGARLKQVALSNLELRESLLRYEASFRTQTMQGMACNGLHSI
jgi:hypothetical protein